MSGGARAEVREVRFWLSVESALRLVFDSPDAESRWHAAERDALTTRLARARIR